MRGSYAMEVFDVNNGETVVRRASKRDSGNGDACSMESYALCGVQMVPNVRVIVDC